MISFLISVAALVVGYLLYGSFVDRVFGPNPNLVTPAVAKADNVDFIAMPAWKVYMIQFLNIAGTGPIFGAIMGAKFGPSAYLWIVFGCIFAGAVHDYLSGMLSVRHGGAGYPVLVGRYLGETTKKAMLVFSVLLLLMVGAVFVYSPAVILGGMVGDGGQWSVMTWVFVVFAYYVIATLLPIDKIIGRIYPVFAAALLFMAVALMVCLLIKWPSLPEFWQGLQNRGPSVGLEGQPIFPCLFITIACGAVSGFHATQSPLMARCITTEKLGRPIFYGAMVTEGLVALIWAAVSSYFFFDGGAAEVGSDLTAAAPVVVTKVSQSWLGVLGGILALLGVVAAPITSGDTAGSDAEAPLHRRSAFRPVGSPALVQHRRCERLQHHLALFRLGQPDALRVHVLDRDRVPGPQQAGPVLSDRPDPGAVHDVGLHDVHPRGQDRAGSSRGHDSVDRPRNICHFGNSFLSLEIS